MGVHNPQVALTLRNSYTCRHTVFEAKFPRRCAIAPRRIYPKQPHEVGVYGILNRVTGKWYVGSSIKLSKRMGRHLWELRNHRHHSQKLQRSFDKHGEQAFEFRILLVCRKEDVHVYEQRAIDALGAATDGYNVAAEPRGGFMRGRAWPEATKAARVEAMKGFRHTEESKQRMRDTLADRTDSAKDLQHQRIGDANRGLTRTTEFKENLRDHMTARYSDPKAREAQAERMRQWWRDRKASEVQN